MNEEQNTTAVAEEENSKVVLPEGFGRRISEYDELPDELKSELSFLERGERRVLTVVENLDGAATLDEIVFGYYKTFEEIEPRAGILAIIQKLVNKEHLKRIKGRRGAYILAGTVEIEETTEELAARLYSEYSASVGGVNFKGDPLPDWEEFSTDESKAKQADAWRHVAKMAS
ncbi:MAG: hypothetical protein AAF514_20105 [Verrucomicrobiota bacterium]